MVKIILGPIIGKVTYNSVRILLEFDSAVTIFCKITSPLEETQQVSNISFPKKKPKAFTIKHLNPDTEYTFTFKSKESKIENYKDRKAIVRTLKKEISNFRFAVVSNNDGEEVDIMMWMRLQKEVIQNPLTRCDLLVHAGNQICTDELFEEAVVLMKEGNAEKVEELYRSCYRQAWNVETVRNILSRVSNLMILSEYDVRENYGLITLKKEFEGKVEEIGLKVYREYQRQLWDEIKDDKTDNHEGHFHIFDKLGFAFLDARVGRMQQSKDHPCISDEQFALLKKQLSNDGEFDEVKALVVVSPIPLAFLNAQLASFFQEAKDHWAFGRYKQEQIQILSLLQQWKNANAQRDVLLIGGDVMFGGHAKITKDEKVVFNQLISSGVTMRAPDKIDFLLTKTDFQDKPLELGEGFQVQHHDYTKERNFAVVDVEIAEKTSFHRCLVEEQHGEIKTVLRKSTHPENEDPQPKCGCIVM